MENTLKHRDHKITREMFRNIYEASPIGIELYDRNGNLVDLNKACADIFGLVDIEEIIGFNLFEDPNISGEHRERLLKGENVSVEIPFDFEMVKAHHLYRTTKSGVIHLDILITPLSVKDNVAIGGYLVQVQDITGRKQAAEALREGEARFRALFEQNAVGVVEIETLTGRFIRVNQRYADIVGSTIEELQNTTFQSITHPDDLNPDLNNMSLLKAGKIRSFVMEKRYVRKDGTTIWAEIAVSPLWAPGEEPTRNFAIVNDITQRKRAEEELKKAYAELELRVRERTSELSAVNASLVAEIAERKLAVEALRESEVKLRTLFESANDAIFIHDLKGNFLDVNRTAYERLGYTKEEILSAKLAVIDTPRFASLLPERFAHLLTYGHAVFESGHMRKDGTPMPVEVNARVIEVEGKKIILSVVRDITERKEAEVALQKAYEEMEARVQERTEELASLNIALEKEKNQIKITNTLLELFVQKISRKEYLDEVVKVIQDWSGYHCVGIRIADESGNIPYESYVGFSQAFMDSENLLSLERDQCACIRVIKEKPEPQDLPAMTKYGSFYSNNTFEFINGLTDADKSRFRNVCCVLNRFKSMAIIPIRYHGNVLGTIHMTDEKEEMVIFKNVLFIETLAPIIGESIYRFNAEENLRKSQEHLRNLTAHLQEVRENERTIIAREIHDELGQIMTALKIELSWVKDKYQDHSDLHKKAISMLSLIDATIQTVKKIITELRPGILDHLGISAALEWQAEEFQKITGTPCDIVIIPEEIILEKYLTTNIFRIFQEILTNIMRHAQATQVSAILEKSAGKIMLSVHDNGKGITDHQISNPASFGILGIHERVNHMGGSFKITGVPGEGTEITIIVPIKDSEEEDFYYFR